MLLKVVTTVAKVWLPVMASENDLTFEKVPSGYTITRHGKFGSMQFFLLKNRDELNKTVDGLKLLLNKEIQNGQC